jgi:O-antigen/teichoic acid export membrane protein
MSARASIAYVAVRALSGAMALGSVVIFARGLGPDAYGWVALATAAAALAASALVVPIGQSLARFLPQEGFEQIAPTLVRIFVASALALLPVALLVEFLHGTHVASGIALGAWALFLAQGMFELSAQHANSRFLVGRYSALYVAKALFIVTAGAGVIWFGAGPVWVVAVIVVANAGCSLLVCTDTWRLAFAGRIDRALLPIVRKFAGTIALVALLSSVIQWADRWMLAAMAGRPVSGSFSACGDLIVQPLTLIASAFFLAWYPRIVTAWEARQANEVVRLANRYFFLSAGLLLPLALGCALLRQDFVNVLLGGRYPETTQDVIPFLALAACIGGLRTFVFDVGLLVSNRLKRLLLNTASAALASAILNLMMIPRFGAVGAGMAAVAAQLLGAFLSWQSTRDLVRWHLPARDVFVLGLALLGLCGAVWLTKTLGLAGVASMATTVFAGAISYAVVIVIGNAGGVRDWLSERMHVRGWR